MHVGRRAALAGALAATAMSPDQKRTVLSGASGPELSLDFLNASLDPRISFARASTAWEFNSAGNLTSFSTNTPRFGYDPTTLALRGLLIEEARTNSLRNNGTTGAVVGTPGTLPTNWSQTNTNGLAANVIGFGTDHGIPYIDVRINGTTASGTSTNIVLESTSAIAAVQNQVWTSSFYLSLTAGSLTNVTSIFHNIQPLTSGAGSLTIGTTTVVPTGSSLASQRNRQTYTLPNATTAFVRPFIQVFCAAAPVAVDLTLRIGAPQFELGAFVTSPILTTSAAITRAAETATVPLTRFGSAGHSLVASAILPVSGGNVTGAYATIDDGSTSNRAALYTPSGLTLAGQVIAGGSTLLDATEGTATAGTAFSLGLAFSPGSQIAALNGADGSTSASAAGYPTGITTLRIGKSFTVWCNSYIRSIKSWPRALSAVELRSVTA